jgi:hypothetical protein
MKGNSWIWRRHPWIGNGLTALPSPALLAFGSTFLSRVNGAHAPRDSPP